MHSRHDHDRLPWFIATIHPSLVERHRRSNIVLISFLMFVVLGIATLTFTPQPGHASSAAASKVPLKIDSNVLKGIEVQNLTPSIAQDLGISAATHGVVISSVDPASAAANAGLQGGDVIQEVNRKPARNVAEFHEVLAANHGQSVLLLINHGGSMRYVVVDSE